MATLVLDEILVYLQNTKIVEDEKEIFYLTPNVVDASYEENMRSCVGKLIGDRDVNVQGL